MHFKFISFKLFLFFFLFYSFFFFLRIQTRRPILLNEIETKLHSIMRNKGSYIFRNIFLFYSCVFLYTWGSIDSSTVVSIENYEIQISRSAFHTYLSYLCRVSFLAIVDIYKDYYKGRLTWCNLMQSDYSLKLWPETICPSSSFS